MPLHDRMSVPIRTAAVSGLLSLVLACGMAGCREDRTDSAEAVTPTAAPAAAPPSIAPPSEPAPLTPPLTEPPPPIRSNPRIPDALHGVWYPDTAQGRADCKAYRAITPAQFEKSIGGAPLIGATIILDRLVHMYSEYGEGAFYAPRNVVPVADGQWRLVSRYWVDSFPGIDAPDDESSQFSIDVLALRNDRLSWYPNQSNTAAAALTSKPDEPALFRCGPVRPEIYSVEPGKD